MIVNTVIFVLTRIIVLVVENATNAITVLIPLNVKHAMNVIIAKTMNVAITNVVVRLNSMIKKVAQKFCIFNLKKNLNK